MTQYNEKKIFNPDEIPSQEISDTAVLEKSPLVSVKMTTYNHAPYIGQAIEGVMVQKTDFPIELVIGEDCSTDKTREIVFEYQKKYPDMIRIITSDKNVGSKKNGYRTTKACRGKYIAFCEGDDYWQHPEKLQKQVNYMEAHPECGMVYADCDVYYEKSKKIRHRFNHNKGFCLNVNLTAEEILWGGMVQFTCTVVVRRDLYEQITENDSYLYKSEELLLGDQQAWAEIALKSSVTYIPECLGTYRILTESASRSSDPKKLWRFYKSVSEMRLYLCDKYSFSENYRKKEEYSLLSSTLRLALYERNPQLALEVRRKKEKFTLKEFFRYYGAKHLVIYYVYRILSKSLNVFSNWLRNSKNDWP